ncbi:hypothetical protein GCM10010123_37740 [Pilimelia anulata]|uniref:Serine protease n=1 Tax=Pilimelia anulata TaxID=53371 RepID=A0A8J3B8Z6_9ACTN|nr:S8 family peptidase [Pilimelia anulata]GGK04239.1 hypothetical protein GCM10010123_37740 [Pilimelia anulata]
MRRAPLTPHRRLAAAAIGTATAAATIAALGLAAPAHAEGVIHGIADAIPDRYIVTLADENSLVASSAADLARRYGGEIRYTYEHALRGFSVTMPERRARQLAADARVASVEQVGMAHITETQNDPPSWGIDRIDQRALPLDKKYTYASSSGVTVYILDTGARLTHKDFTGRISSGRDFIDNDADASDCNGHGTHVAGTAAGTTFGVAKQAKIVAVRVLDCQGSGPWDTITKGVDWVTGNAAKPAVANMSLGGNGTQAALESAVRKSIGAGVTYALAAGNNGGDACGFSPAREPLAITVGNSDPNDSRWTGSPGPSNYGRCLDIFAPGRNIVSASHSSDTGSATMTGTSMASPHVAGAAALYLAANRDATPQQVREALVSTNGIKDKLTNVGSGSPNVLLYTGPPAAAR